MDLWYRGIVGKKLMRGSIGEHLFALGQIKKICTALTPVIVYQGRDVVFKNQVWLAASLLGYELMKELRRVKLKDGWVYDVSKGGGFLVSGRNFVETYPKSTGNRLVSVTISNLASSTGHRLCYFSDMLSPREENVLKKSIGHKNLFLLDLTHFHKCVTSVTSAQGRFCFVDYKNVTSSSPPKVLSQCIWNSYTLQESQTESKQITSKDLFQLAHYASYFSYWFDMFSDARQIVVCRWQVLP